MKRLVAPFLPYIHLAIIVALLSVTVPHVALLVERYEQDGFWSVAWAFACATEVAIAVTAFLLGATHERQRVLCLAALFFFGVASALFNAAYFLTNGAPAWLAASLGAFIPVAVALLAYLGNVIGTGPRKGEKRQDDGMPVVRIDRGVICHARTQQIAGPENVRDVARRMVAEGKPVREVAGMLGKSVSQVYRYVRSRKNGAS